jgi:hypothetical protein
MYVAKISRRGLLVDARIFKKVWSEDIASNKIIRINDNSFLLKSSAFRWVHKQLFVYLEDQGELEVINE